MPHGFIEILLIEDNPTDAELTICALKEANLANNLIWVKDGALALDFVFCRRAYAGREMEATPKIILLDLRLPKVDGMEVLREIKADARARAIPIVVFTSSKEDRDMVESYHLGVNSFISKPVEYDAFAQVVAQLGLYWLLVNRPLQ
ncbi:MAG: response regulator [Candidatus Methylumidiphilus sp.]